MQPIDISYSLLNAPVTGDVVVSNGNLVITGTPTMKYLDVLSAPGFLKSKAENLQSWITTPPASPANSTTYSILITQQLASGAIQRFVISTTTALSGTTQTDIVTAWKAIINGYVASGTLDVTATGTTTLIVTGVAGNPLVTVTAVEGIISANITSNQASASIASNGSAGVFTFGAVPVGVAVGSTVVIAGNSAADGTYRVAATNGTTTVTIEALDYPYTAQTFNNTTGGTMTITAQRSVGTAADIAASPAGNFVTPTTNATYTTFKRTYKSAPNGSVAGVEQYPYLNVLFLNEAGASYAATIAKLITTLEGTVGGVADPEIEALA